MQWAGFLLGLLLLEASFTLCSQAKVVPFISLGFLFDYNKVGENVPIPITAQCERINIKWSRGQDVQGQNPVAPYFLHVFTSVHTTPFIIPAGNGLTFDWDVPFAPGTQYQICMFSSNGVPGGCQAMYTIVQNRTVANPICQNVTAPPQLAIEGRVSTPEGPISQYGFIKQCTDISIKPLGGEPPYILTISPPLHPPYNITSNNKDPIIWTVSLSWSYPFFMSLRSADGQMWANGPMHAGGFDPDDSCLSPGSIRRSKATALAAGASVGSLAAGIFLGIGSIWLLGFARSWGRRHGFHEFDNTPVIPFDVTTGRPHHPLPHLPERSVSLGRSQTLDGTEWNPDARPAYYSTREYIIHYDGGRLREASEVMELPPLYETQTSVTRSTTDTEGRSRESGKQ